MPRNRYHASPPLDHFDGLRFFNPGQRSTDLSLAELLRVQFREGKAKWPRIVEVRQVKPEPLVNWLLVTMIGHVSVLIQAAGLNIHVDPVWSERASPMPGAGPKRVARPNVAFNDLPPIDSVLFTHNHYDHTDMANLGRIHPAHRPKIVTVLGIDMIIRSAAPDANPVALDWGGVCELALGVTVTSVPAHH